jgi:nicotinamide-nucleotide amidase
VAVLKVFGTGESDVARLLEGLGGRLSGRIRLKVQYRATFPEIHVRLVLSGADGRHAEELLEGLLADARRRLAAYVYASGGPELETRFSDRVTADLRRAGATVAFAEGCTAGLAGQLLGDADPEGEVFLGAVVTPTAGAVSGQLGLPRETLEEAGLLSEETVRRMAEAVRTRFTSSLGVAVVGTPHPRFQRPAGTLRAAVADGSRCSVRSFRFPLETDRFRLLAAYLALSLARRAVTGERKT